MKQDQQEHEQLRLVKFITDPLQLRMACKEMTDGTEGAADLIEVVMVRARKKADEQPDLDHLTSEAHYDGCNLLAVVDVYAAHSGLFCTYGLLFEVLADLDLEEVVASSRAYVQKSSELVYETRLKNATSCDCCACRN